MTTDNFFNAKRFVRVCRKEITEQSKTLLLRFIMTYGILALVLIWYGMIMYGVFNYYSENQTTITSINLDRIQLSMVTIFFIGLASLSCISASCIMEPMKRKTGRTAFLMYPASMFEKYMARWAIYTIGFFVAYVIAFCLADWTWILVGNMYYDNVDIPALSPADFQRFMDTGKPWLLTISGICCIQSVFVLGSTVWPKHTLIKTVAALVAIGIAHIFIIQTVNHFTGHGVIRNSGIVILNFAITLCCWTLAYFRFKESEIINRW